MTHRITISAGVKMRNASEFAVAIALSIGLNLTVAKKAVASQIVVAVTSYITQSSGGQALCSGTPQGGLACIHSYPNQYGEMDLVSTVNGSITGVDYIARSTGGGANGGMYFGVIRSLDNTQSPSSADYLRCFGNPGQPCYAPSDADAMPEAVPEFLDLNVVSQQDDVNASFADGSARTQIAGGKSITGLTSFEV